MSDTNQRQTLTAEENNAIRFKDAIAGVTSQRPTPITDEHEFDMLVNRYPNMWDKVVKSEIVRDLERQLAEVRESGQRKVTEMAHRIAQLEHDLKHAREQRDSLAVLAGEIIAMIRVNVMRDTFREITIDQVDEHLKPWIERISELERSENEPR